MKLRLALNRLGFALMLLTLCTAVQALPVKHIAGAHRHRVDRPECGQLRGIANLSGGQRREAAALDARRSLAARFDAGHSIELERADRPARCAAFQPVLSRRQCRGAALASGGRGYRSVGGPCAASVAARHHAVRGNRQAGRACDRGARREHADVHQRRGLRRPSHLQRPRALRSRAVPVPMPGAASRAIRWSVP